MEDEDCGKMKQGIPFSKINLIGKKTQKSLNASRREMHRNILPPLKNITSDSSSLDLKEVTLFILRSMHIIVAYCLSIRNGFFKDLMIKKGEPIISRFELEYLSSKYFLDIKNSSVFS